MPEDNDWPVQPRRISPEEADSFPKHGEPGPPSLAQKEEHRQQVEKEKVHKHPAHDTPEPD